MGVWGPSSEVRIVKGNLDFFKKLDTGDQVIQTLSCIAEIAILQLLFNLICRQLLF